MFVYEIKSVNLYSFAIGSNSSVYLTFDKFGDLVNARWSSLLIRDTATAESSTISPRGDKKTRRSGGGNKMINSSSTQAPLGSASTQQAPTSCHLLYVHTKLSDAIMLNSVNRPVKIASTIVRSRGGGVEKGEKRKINSRSRDNQNYHNYYHQNRRVNHQNKAVVAATRRLKLKRNRPFKKNKNNHHQPQKVE